MVYRLRHVEIVGAQSNQLLPARGGEAEHSLAGFPEPRQKGETTTLSNSQNNSLNNLLLSEVFLVSFGLTIM